MAIQNVGTLTINDLLAVDYQSVLEFGLEKITEVLDADNAAHNSIVDDLVGTFAATDTRRAFVAGSSSNFDFEPAGEFTRALAQKQKQGTEIQVPLDRFQTAIGWTGDWFRMHTPQDMAQQQLAIQKAHLRRVSAELRESFYFSSNYTYDDWLVDGFTLNVKRLVNADGAPIPDGPHGEKFDGATHTHYLGSATLTTTAVDALILTVIEHGHGANVVICINQADEGGFKALTGFKEFERPNVQLGTEANKAIPTLDIGRVDNRPIGFYGAATIWVKPWAIANYAVCTAAGDSLKPLVRRISEFPALRGLRRRAQIEIFPLAAEYMDDHFGFGALNRTNGAVLRFDNATYADPAIPF